MKTKQMILMGVLCALSIARIMAQGNETSSAGLQVGRPMLGFSLTGIRQYKTDRVSLDDFKGRWLVLDFWDTGCTDCLYNFQRVNGFTEWIEKEVTWVMVGVSGADHTKQGDPQKVYEMARKKWGLQAPFVFDSLLAKKWGLTSFPLMLIVDPQGVLKYITKGDEITPRFMRDLTKGRDPGFQLEDISQREANFLVIPEPKSGDDLFFRSVLTVYGGEKTHPLMPLDDWMKLPDTEKAKGYSCVGTRLQDLFMIAFSGALKDSGNVVYGKPVVETKDSASFSYRYPNYYRFNYHLRFPVEGLTKEKIMLAMQRRLATLSYVASFEVRDMDVYSLKAGPGAVGKLKAKGNERQKSTGTSVLGFEWQNVPASQLLNSLVFCLRERPFALPFVDETGLTGNIDIHIEGDLSDLQGVRSALKRYNLDLIRSTKKMKVLVVRSVRYSGMRH